MGRYELLAALEREGQETMAASVASSAAEKGRLRAESEERRLALRRKDEEERELLCSNRRRTILTKANREAALICLRAEDEVAQRLYERACFCLKELRRDNAERLFCLLANELPVMTWHTIRTSPDDLPLAKARFPAATIIPDESVSGGLKVASAEKSLTVDNTLNTRLEKVWPDLLPLLFSELREKCDEEL